MATDQDVGRTQPSPWPSVIAAVVWAVSCVVLTYRGFLSMGGGAASASIATIVVTGVPVVFVAIRVAVVLNAHERGDPVAFWPGDRSSSIENWGLLLLMLAFAVATIMAASGLDQWLFDGQLGSLLGDVSE